MASRRGVHVYGFELKTERPSVTYLWTVRNIAIVAPVLKNVVTTIGTTPNKMAAVLDVA